MNNIYAQKRILSAKAPVIKAGVMMANLAWNKANNINGMVPAKLHAVLVPTP